MSVHFKAIQNFEYRYGHTTYKPNKKQIGPNLKILVMLFIQEHFNQKLLS